MKTLSQRLACVAAALVLFAAVGFSSSAYAADDDAGQNVASITVSPKLTKADVEQAIQQALVSRKWIVKDKSDGTVVAHYERGKNSATLTIRYDSTKIDIYAVGQARGGGLPTRWIDGLKKDLDVFLGRAVLSK